VVPRTGKTTSPGATGAGGNSTSAPAAADAAASTPSFYSMFPVYQDSPETAPAAPPQAPPTAQSVFGANPWLTNPTGNNPDGTSYGFNPLYFATPQTAAQVAQMVGGQVVSENAICSVQGAFSQNQPNLMVQLPDGGLINPGLVASFYTHGYPQSMVDQMVASEVAGATT